MNDEKNLAELKQLYKLCKPLVEYMQENNTMHDLLVITDSSAKIFKGDMSVPIPIEEWDDKDNAR